MCLLFILFYYGKFAFKISYTLKINLTPRFSTEVVSLPLEKNGSWNTDLCSYINILLLNLTLCCEYSKDVQFYKIYISSLSLSMESLIRSPE